MIRIAVEEVWINTTTEGHLAETEPPSLLRLRDALAKEKAGPFWQSRRTDGSSLVGVTIVSSDVTNISRVRGIIMDWMAKENT